MQTPEIKSIQIRLTKFDYAKIITMRDKGFIKNPTAFCTRAVELYLEKKYKEFQESISNIS